MYLFLYNYFFLTISVGAIILTSVGPTFTKFSGLVDGYRKPLAFRPRKRRCYGNQFCGPNPQNWVRATRSAGNALDVGKPVN